MSPKQTTETFDINNVSHQKHPVQYNLFMYSTHSWLTGTNRKSLVKMSTWRVQVFTLWCLMWRSLRRRRNEQRRRRAQTGETKPSITMETSIISGEEPRCHALFGWNVTLEIVTAFFTSTWYKINESMKIIYRLNSETTVVALTWTK